MWIGKLLKNYYGKNRKFQVFKKRGQPQDKTAKIHNNHTEMKNNPNKNLASYKWVI